VRGKPANTSRSCRESVLTPFVAACTSVGIEPEAFQLRDLRAKAATDKADSAGDIREAQNQLGHTSVVMTEQYTRNRRGAKVTPTR